MGDYRKAPTKAETAKYLRDFKAIKKGCYKALMAGTPWMIHQFERECSERGISAGFGHPENYRSFERIPKGKELYVVLTGGLLDLDLTPEQINTHIAIRVKLLPSKPPKGYETMSAMDRLRVANGDY